MSTTPAVKPVPDGYHTATPYLVIKGASAALDWYAEVFEAHLHLRLDGPGGLVAHAETRIGDSLIMLADEQPDMPCTSPATLGGTTVSLMLYVPDAGAVLARAEAAGARVTRPLADQFYGDRAATFFDPFGHQWTVATHIEDVPPDEIERRLEALRREGAPV